MSALAGIRNDESSVIARSAATRQSMTLGWPRYARNDEAGMFEISMSLTLAGIQSDKV